MRVPTPHSVNALALAAALAVVATGADIGVAQAHPAHQQRAASAKHKKSKKAPKHHSSTGQRGPRGATGPQGPAGANGKNGTNGTNGTNGLTGPPGAPNPNATTVDGETVTRLFKVEPTPATTMTILPLFTGDGLTILAECDNAGNASLVANGPASADAQLATTGYSNAGPFGLTFNNLAPASNDPLSAGNSGTTSFSYATAGGDVVSGTIGYQTAPSFGTVNGCGFYGTVTSS